MPRRSWAGPFGRWGATDGEAALVLGCDEHEPDPDQVLVRAIDVDAPADVVFRWLCQLRVAPYSYDWLDNRGRRSPRVLTPGVERLEVGQPVMRIFELAGFEDGRSLTIVHRGPVFGHLAGTYSVTPLAGGGSRILVRVCGRYPRGPLGTAMSLVLPAGDLVMMRKQLRTLRDLAEAEA